MKRFTLSSLAAGALLLATSCASPTRAEIGQLTVVNEMDRPVAFVATWQEGADTLYGNLEGLVPAAEAEIAIRQGGRIPAGTTILFAIEGEGYDGLLERNGVKAGKLMPAVFEEDGVTMESASSAFLTRGLSSKADSQVELAPTQLTWVYPGGEVELTLEDDGAGGIRATER